MTPRVCRLELLEGVHKSVLKIAHNWVRRRISPDSNVRPVSASQFYRAWHYLLASLGRWGYFYFQGAHQAMTFAWHLWAPSAGHGWNRSA
ncbi:hypothetical protein FRC08_002359 [Ceratobasidium sp. 394]|nr:hypothetical protein FRC08_002359 [Ceratobasidium sp. 394]